MPTRRLTFLGGISLLSRPSIKTTPSVDSSGRFKRRRNEDLPESLDPTIAITSPRQISTETSLAMALPSPLRPRCSVRSTGSDPVEYPAHMRLLIVLAGARIVEP